MRHFLCIQQQSWDRSHPEPFYSFVFFKCMTLAASLGCFLLFLTSLSSPDASPIYAVLQGLFCLSVSLLHILVRSYQYLKAAASGFLLAVFLLLFYMLLNSRSGDASGAYHFVAPLLFVCVFLLGVPVASLLLAFFSAFYLGMAFDLFTSWGWLDLPQLVLVRRQIYIDRWLEMITIFAGAVSFNRIKQEQQKLIREQEKMAAERQTMQALASMAAGSAHEINNPLAILTGYLDNLEQRSWVHEQGRPLVKKMQATCRRIERFVLSIKVFTQQHQFKTETIELRPLFTELKIMLEQVTREKPSSVINYGLEGNEQLYLRADREVLQMLLHALTINAYEACSEQVKPTIKWKISEDANNLSLSCQDNGPDFDPALTEKFCLPLYTSKLDRPYRGMGLATCHVLVSKLGWQLSFKRELGWTIGTISMPRDLIVLPIRPSDEVA